jgi:hypothetical protein
MDITNVHTIDTQGPERMKDAAAKPAEAMNRINKFSETGEPLFAKYMRFSQPVPLISRIAARSRRRISRLMTALGRRYG